MEYPHYSGCGPSAPQDVVDNLTFVFTGPLQLEQPYSINDLSHNLAIIVRYVGNHAEHVMGSHQFNPAVSQSWRSADERQMPSSSKTKACCKSRPFQILFGSANGNRTRVLRLRISRPNP
jgi:hypothetical protein